MNWLALLTGLLKLTNAVFEYINTRQLLKAGEAQAFLQELEALNERVDKALAARDAINTDVNDPGLYNDDGYRRD